MLYNIIFEDGTDIFVEYLELIDTIKVFNYLGLNYKAHLIEDKMYAIHWFDYIDDEWSILWCTEDKFKRSLEDVKDAEVEYYIKEYN
jgi:hypothetical protein